MESKPVQPTPEVFNASVPAWVGYTASASGMLRSAVILHHLCAHLQGRSLRVLDAGGGTGEMAEALAAQGHHVVLMDFSPAMLDEAKRRCGELIMTYLCAEVSEVGAIFEPMSFDVVLCNSLIEFVGDAEGVIAQLANLLRSTGVLSVVVGNRYHTPLRRALLKQDFDGALLGLDSELPAKDLFGLQLRTMFPEVVRQMIERQKFRVAGEYGVRVFADLISGQLTDMEGLLALELAAGTRMPYRHIARFIQFVAVKD